MVKIFHRKLIRDKIPELISSTGGQCLTRVMNIKEFESMLKKKLVEEAKELAAAKRKDLVNELADVLELVKSISNYYKINFSQVVKYQQEKRKKRGGFSKKLFLVWSTRTY